MSQRSDLGIDNAEAGHDNRLLIAEDEPVSRQILDKLAQSWGYETVVVKDGDQTLQTLNSANAPRLAVLDWMMPGVNGLEVCRELRSRTGVPYTYVIVLTALNELDRMIEAMEAGADDFLGKPFQPHELEVRLRAGKRIVLLQQELIDARETLRKLATTDALTETWNRRSILDRLDKELARASRDRMGRGPGVLMGDLDHFKQINDSHGHLVGDQVLRETGSRIRKLLRSHDEVGRFGGEEFLIVVCDCDRNALVRVAERVRAGIGDSKIETTSGPVRVTLSIGGAVNDHGCPSNATTLIERADYAMYEAKNAGRDRVVMADE